ncbi:MAG: hypothetical protein WBW45_10585, partial [Bradyrhizobium sp.]
MKAKAFAQDRLLICPHGERKVIVFAKLARRELRYPLSRSIYGINAAAGASAHWGGNVPAAAMALEAIDLPCGQKPGPQRFSQVPTFRSSCSVAAPTFTNFGKLWALANLLILV